MNKFDRISQFLVPLLKTEINGIELPATARSHA